MQLFVPKLKIYLHVHLLMGIKNQNLKLYWVTLVPFLQCPVISLKITRTYFELITLCLHVRNPTYVVIDYLNPLYNKVDKIRWAK